MPIICPARLAMPIDNKALLEWVNLELVSVQDHIGGATNGEGDVENQEARDEVEPGSAN